MHIQAPTPYYLFDTSSLLRHVACQIEAPTQYYLSDTYRLYHG